MPYPEPSAAQIGAFEAEGFLVVPDAIQPEDLAPLGAVCDRILANKETYAFDWAWEAGTERGERAFRIVQSSPTRLAPELAGEPFRRWATAFASALLRRPCEFWYDQFLGKPPHEGARTPWHQDEAYWGRNLDERGITCWMPLHDVDTENGCMHFLPGAHRLGVRPHRAAEGVQSDLLVCDVDEARAVACPLSLGGVTFHHGKTPHMTTPNRSAAWRRALSQHFRVQGSLGEGDHYPWKVYVNQFTGERLVPRSARS
jgi:phytanoyl-CoA hydroxylase